MWTTRRRSGSFRTGSARMRPASSIWRGCAGRRVPSARVEVDENSQKPRPALLPTPPTGHEHRSRAPDRPRHPRETDPLQAQDRRDSAARRRSPEHQKWLGLVVEALGNTRLARKGEWPLGRVAKPGIVAVAFVRPGSTVGHVALLGGGCRIQVSQEHDRFPLYRPEDACTTETDSGHG